MRIENYYTASGREPYEDWLRSLKNQKTILRIRNRIIKIREFNHLGDYKHLEDELYELRLNFGPGYRIYFTIKKDGTIFLLNAGDKSTQTKDIQKAKQYLEDLQND
jgi:putative addiction module killer protein